MISPTDDKKADDELAHLREQVARLQKALNRKSPNLDMLLKRRGFIIYKREPSDDLLIPSKKFLFGYYHQLHKYSFRLFLRDVIKQRERFSLDDVTHYATSAVTNEYLDYLQSIKLVRRKEMTYTLVKGPVKSFGETLEWYIAEMFKREFGAESAWGVKFKRPKVGGDYDVIANFNGSLLYVETKSSPPKQIYDSEIAAFLDRVADLAPAISVFLMDTELRMKDKLVPMFEKELLKRYVNPPPVTQLERELFHIQDRIFILNAKESVLQNFQKAMRCYYQKTSGLP